MTRHVERLRTPAHAGTHPLISLAWLKPSRFKDRLRFRVEFLWFKNCHLQSERCIHRLLDWIHSRTTRTPCTWTPLSTSTTSRPESQIAVTLQPCLAILPYKPLLQIVSPTSTLKTCPRTVLRRSHGYPGRSLINLFSDRSYRNEKESARKENHAVSNMTKTRESQEIDQVLLRLKALSKDRKRGKDAAKGNVPKGTSPSGKPKSA